MQLQIFQIFLVGSDIKTIKKFCLSQKVVDFSWAMKHAVNESFHQVSTAVRLVME
jgi:hypothetical protein